MDGKITVKYLQNYVKAKDYKPEQINAYFLKLTEEVGELASAIRKNRVRTESGSVKDTIDEELWDVIYYVIALANCYGIDLETVIPEKERLNHDRYPADIEFQENR